jgi:hypothetical protein
MSYEGQDELITLFGKGRQVHESSRDNLTPGQKAQATISVILRFFGYPLAFFSGLMALLTTLSFYGTYNHLAHWPHTVAEVNSCDVYKSEAAQSQPGMHTSFLYGFRCEVIYDAQSVSHQAVADIGYQTSDRGEMWVRWSNRIQRGDHIEIIYNPSNPERANFAGDFSLACSSAINTLKITLWVGLAAFVMIGAGRKLRPSSDVDNATP